MLKKLLVSGSTLLMIAGLGIGTASAKHVRHNRYHARTVRVVKRHRRKTVRHVRRRGHKHRVSLYEREVKLERKIAMLKAKNAGKPYHRPRHLRLSNIFSNTRIYRPSAKDRRFSRAVSYWLLKDINKTRRRHHVHALRVSPLLQRCADYRAPRARYAYTHPLTGAKVVMHKEHLTPTRIIAEGGAPDGWIHGLDTHTSNTNWMNRHHCSFAGYGENAGSFKRGGKSAIDGYRLAKSGKTPKQVAETINHAYMHEDGSDGNHGGHAEQELDPSYWYVAVSCAYDSKSNQGANVVEYGYY